MKKLKGLLVDVDYENFEDAVTGESLDGAIKVVLKNKDELITVYDKEYKPYFLFDATKMDNGELEKFVESVNRKARESGEREEDRIIRVEIVKKIVKGIEKDLFKIICRHPKDIPLLREYFKDFGEVYESTIPFKIRYIIDKNLCPLNEVEVVLDEAMEDNKSLEKEERKEEGQIKKEKLVYITEVKDCGKSEEKLNVLCFDIEVYAPYMVPREKKDPIIIISYYDINKRECGALTWGRINDHIDEDVKLEILKNEKEMLERFCRLINEKKIDLLVGYNSAAFDIPYLKKRANLLGINLNLGRDGSEPEIRRHGVTSHVLIEGRIHFDIFYTVRLLAAAQALKTQRYTLEEVYKELFNKEKIDLPEEEMCAIWDDEKRRKDYITYACSDSKATAEIFEKLYPLIVEFSSLSKIPLKDISGITSGQLVEAVLMDSAVRSSELIPDKPYGEEIEGRTDEAITGAYVKMPDPGIYDNIVVYDFRSLYPSIIVSHNIGPSTLNCGHEECREKNSSPNGNYFCTKINDLIPLTLRRLLEKRKELKIKLKGATGEEATLLNAKVAALKIITNTFYGLLRYPRARWYCREGAESVTAWGRYYIQSISKEAEDRGFKVLYVDTDSVFLLLGEKEEKDLYDFIEEINSKLPEMMELELEDFYTRGVFVAKKTKEEHGAKKKYALISKKGKIKIRGFELVRRDWSNIARETQKMVLESILKEGSKEKAIEIVKEVINKLREGRVKKEDLIIWTQLRKKKYEVISPELAAAEKARKRGVKISSGAIIGYVITREGRNISEKAELAQFAKSYDIDYYINNQVIPAVLKIMGELGYSEEDIKYIGKQSSLGEWL